jgi:hypothetical protein
MAATKKRTYAAFTAAEKVWLLDDHDKNPKVDASDLVIKLDEHVNVTRKEDQVDKPPPGKATVNDWRKAAYKIRKMATNLNSAAASCQRAPKQPRMEEA